MPEKASPIISDSDDGLGKETPLAKIDSMKFGSIKIGGRRYCMRDVLIFPDGTIRRRNLGRWIGSHHSFGREDIAGLVAAGAKIIVIGTGMSSGARVKGELRAYADQSRIGLVEMPSREAARKCNELQADGKKVGTIIHLLC